MPFSFLPLSIQSLSVISPTPHHTSASTTHNEQSSSIASRHIQISTPIFMERTIPSHPQHAIQPQTYLSITSTLEEIQAPSSLKPSKSASTKSSVCHARGISHQVQHYTAPAAAAAAEIKQNTSHQQNRKRNTKTGEETMIMAGWVGRPVRSGCHLGY
jgi:hypothetical protein